MSDGARTAGGGAWIIVRDAVIVTAACTAIAFLANAVRRDAIPFVADEEWFHARLYQPCPEPGADVTIEGLPADAERVRSARTLLVDARPPADFAAWHLPGAINVPHDPLMEPTEEEKARIALEIARTGRRQVLVYSTGDYPDAEDLGRLLVTHGIRNVYFVQGGDAALRGRSPGTPEEER